MVLMERLVRNRFSVLASLLFIIPSFKLAAQGNCPDVQINFTIPPVICFDPSVNFVDLEVAVTGGNGAGAGQWSGANITNTTEGIFRTAFAQAGEQKVYYTYTEGTCTYRDSATFLFSRLSTPFFQVSSEQNGHLCQDSFSVVRVISPYDHATTNLVWDLAGGTAVEQGSPDLLHVTWDSPGNKLLRLQYEQFGCLSQPLFQQVILDPTIDTPVVQCFNTLERVVYDWVDPPFSSATVVFVITGPNGVVDTVNDRYTIENLLPGQIVQVRMVTTSENTCDGNFIDPVCESIPCDGNLLDIDPIQTVCVSGGATDTISLGYTLMDTITQSSLSWSGAGVFDPTDARIAINPSMAGQTNWVYLTFQSATCTVTDSVSFELIPPPVADFTLPATACQDQPVPVNLPIGPISANSDTSLIWDFGDAIVSGDPDAGTPELSWPTIGTKSVGLALKVGACVSETIFRFVNVQPAPEAAVITCTPSANSIRFSWQTIPGAQFDVAVLEGPAGVRISTTSYEVTGLTANQTVTIQVTTRGAGLCNTRVSTQSCTPLDCPAVSVDIQDIPAVCLQATPVPINLQATITGGSGGGVLRWSGPNVTGSTWTPDASLSGQTVAIRAEYQENGCVYQDIIQVTVPEPLIANFALPNVACMTDAISVTALGNFSVNTIYNWMLDGNNLPAFIGPGPHLLNWPAPGPHEVSLIVQEGQCSSLPLRRDILVSAPLPAPVVTCEAGTDQILFTWNPVPGAQDYLVNVLLGPAGSRTSDTSMLFTGLMPGQEIQIAVVVENDGSCPDSRTEMSCRTPGCPDVSITIQQPTQGEVICIGTQDSVISILSAITGSNGTGALTFSGTGASGGLSNLWTVSPAMAGQTHTLTLTYTENGCTYSEQVLVAVQRTPVAAFTLPQALCPGENATVIFTGTASPGAVYEWSNPALNGPGPHVINFNQPGPAMLDLGLRITEGQCSSASVTRSAQIYGQYPAPVVSCESSLDEVVFTWQSEDVDRQEVIYNGPGNGLQTSDTSFVVSGLAPQTNVNLTVRFVDDAFPCRNTTTVASCITASCGLLALDWSAPAAVCEGENVEITFSATGAGFDVVIRHGSQTTTHSGIRDGSVLSFTLTATETFTITAAGLPGNTSCSVPLPGPLTVAVQTATDPGIQTVFPSVCAGIDSLVNLSNLMSNPAATGQWSFVSGPQDPGSAFSRAAGTLRLDNLTAGSYQFSYQTGPGSVCTAGSAIARIEILSSPVADAGPDLSLDCEINIAGIGSNGAMPGLVYQWQGPVPGAVLDPSSALTDVTQAGLYTLRVSNPATGCSDTDEVQVSAAPGMITAFASVLPLSCFNSNDGLISIDSISGGAAPFTVILNGVNQGSRSVFSNLPAGNYELQINSSDGCETSLMLSVTAPNQLDVKLTSDIEQDRNIVSAGDSVLLTALINIPLDQVAGITWISGEGNISGHSLTHVIRPLTTSSYWVEITDVNGCKAGDRLAIVVQRNVNVFIPSAFSPNEDGNNDIFYIQADQSVRQILSFNVYNRWGEQLFAQKAFQPNDPTEGWDGDARGVPQPSAVYVYQVMLELATGEVVQMTGDVALLR